MYIQVDTAQHGQVGAGPFTGPDGDALLGVELAPLELLLGAGGMAQAEDDQYQLCVAGKLSSLMLGELQASSTKDSSSLLLGRRQSL